MDKDWLKDAIHESAVRTFDAKYSSDSNVNDEIRLAYQKLKNTDEFQALKEKLVNHYEKLKTQEVLNQLSGVKDLLDAES